MLSNLIKSGFVAFSRENALVIDANENKIIKGIEETEQEAAALFEDSVEEELAEAMIQDAGLDDESKEDDALLAMNADNIKTLSSSLPGIASEMVKAAKTEAEEIVAGAHEEVRQLRAQAYEEAEEIKKQAREEGYQKGYQEGLDTANHECIQKKEEMEQQMQEFIARLEEQEELLVRTTEQKMVDLLCQLIPAVTGVVIEDQKDVILYMINAAMRDLDNSRHFVIRVSGDDYKEVSERKEEIYGAGNPNIDLEVFEDAKLSPMECLIETDNGIVDLSLGVQLDNLKKALKLMIQE